MTGGRHTKVVVAVVFEGFALLDLAGPADVFRAATLLGPAPGYRLVVASPDGLPVRSASGVTVAPDTSLSEIAEGRRIDTLLVAGGTRAQVLVEDTAALAHLSRVSGHSRRTTSVCTGSLALAAAGLLDGYRATTHWASCDTLASRHPKVSVEPDRIYVHDRDRWTSAGVTAGIDLCLALVEADMGPEVAHSVARWLVVFVRRPGGQAQFSVQLHFHPGSTPAIADLQRWLPDHLDEDLSVEALARQAGMSVRTFARTFRAEVGSTPAALVEAMRVEAAKRLLEATYMTVGAVARSVGFRRPETLHRAFLRRVGTTPDTYRQHFQRRAS